ncbi:MAG: hypothetical protein AAGA59_08250 [Actinomycetota bacterium]
MIASASPGLLGTLGLPGALLVALVVVVLGYSIARRFRPHATWFTDLAKLCAKLRRIDRPGNGDRRPPLPMPHGVWPHCEVGPRMWRWPLNLTRWFCAAFWTGIGHRYGLLFTVARLAWWPSVGLGFLAAVVQALVLMTLFTLPVAALLFVFDTATVIRGGTPPAHRISPTKRLLITEREEEKRTNRLAQIRSDVAAIERAAA